MFFKLFLEADCQGPLPFRICTLYTVPKPPCPNFSENAKLFVAAIIILNGKQCTSVLLVPRSSLFSRLLNNSSRLLPPVIVRKSDELVHSIFWQVTLILLLSYNFTSLFLLPEQPISKCNYYE